MLFTSKKDRYGYELVVEVSKVVNVNEGTIYSLLKRLTNEGYFETFVNKMFIGLPVSVYNIISRCSSILVYALYIMFVFVAFVKVLKEKVIDNFDVKVENNKYIVKIYSPDYFNAYCDNYYENYLYCGTRYPYYDFYKIILNDIKEKKFYNYDSFNTVRLEIIANEKTMSELNIKG